MSDNDFYPHDWNNTNPIPTWYKVVVIIGWLVLGIVFFGLVIYGLGKIKP